MSKKKKIYAITNEDHIKVGISSDPIKRLAALKTGSPVPLRVITIFDGDEKTERKIHKELERYRTTGGGREWFYHNDQVISIIKCYAGETAISSSKDYLIDKYGENYEELIDIKRKKMRKTKRCKVCRSPMTVRSSKGSKFWGCTSYPECKKTEPVITKDTIRCTKCKSGVMVKRKGKYGNFLGCSNYPTCKNVMKEV